MPAYINTNQFNMYSKISRCLDPEKARKLPRPLRNLLWSMPIRLGENVSSKLHQDIGGLLDVSSLKHHVSERGHEISETQVTSSQQEMLLKSLEASLNLQGNIAEIGSWRGVTTCMLASNTEKTVYAIDPHPVGAFPGVDEAYEAFAERVRDVPNIRYVRETSGTACQTCGKEQFSLIFIDAMHDFVSANFDIQTWLPRLVSNGFLVLHDVDDHAGVNLACRMAIRHNRLVPWAYCPNLLVLRKSAD